MSTAARFPMEALFTLACDSANVLEGAVLVQGAADDTCALPSAASSNAPLLGLAYTTGLTTTGGQMTIVAPGGVWPAIAAGTIARGDVVVIGGATGTVVAASLTTPANATRVGIAMEAAISGSRVAVLIGSVPTFSGTVVPMLAGVGGVTANRVVMAAGASTVVLPGGASPTAALIGVALNTAIAGATAYVVTSGTAVVTDSGSGVTANDYITAAGVTGLGLTAAPAGGTNCAVVGVALNTTAASGAITVSVSPGRIQG